MSPRAAVAFDATGTLIEPTEPVGEVYARVAREYGVDLPAWRLEDGFRRILRHAGPRGLDGEDEEARREGEVAWWFEVIRQTFQATDSTARFSDFRGFAGALFDAYRASGAWRTRAGAEGLLAHLRTRSIPMGVVSNFDHRLPEILKDLEIIDYFDSIETPCRHGRAKPDAALFAASAEALGVEVDRLVYVGDDADEVLAAIRDLGITVVDVRALPTPEALATAVAAALVDPT
ncbi:MAG: HAD-IA family hydrolase [bacterium]|nr:HAD-IA family hydrolase [bacterium]